MSLNCFLPLTRLKSASGPIYEFRKVFLSSNSSFSMKKEASCTCDQSTVATDFDSMPFEMYCASKLDS